MFGQAATFFQAAIVALAVLRPTFAFTISSYAADCKTANFTLALTPAEYQAADTYYFMLQTPSGSNRSAFFDFIGPNPSDPLFTANALKTPLTITWATPLTSGGNSTWEFGLYSNGNLINYPNEDFADWLSFDHNIYCDASASTTTSYQVSTVSAYVTPTPSASNLLTTILPSLSSLTSNGVQATQIIYTNTSTSMVGPIAGGVVGGLAVIALTIVAIIWLLRRHPRALITPASTMEQGGYSGKGGDGDASGNDKSGAVPATPGMSSNYSSLPVTPATAMGSPGSPNSWNPGHNGAFFGAAAAAAPAAVPAGGNILMVDAATGQVLGSTNAATSPNSVITPVDMAGFHAQDGPDGLPAYEAGEGGQAGASTAVPAAEKSGLHHVHRHPDDADIVASGSGTASGSGSGSGSGSAAPAAEKPGLHHVHQHHHDMEIVASGPSAASGPGFGPSPSGSTPAPETTTTSSSALPAAQPSAHPPNPLLL
ncbi:hypothetical protein OC835_005688 [Tilletia horrida]|nr:hypothetical protein OC835_005688 [Tilletia horrida]